MCRQCNGCSSVRDSHWSAFSSGPGVTARRSDAIDRLDPGHSPRRLTATIHQPLQALRLIDGQPTMQRLARHSVKDRPKKLSSISRNTVKHPPEPKRQASAEVIHITTYPRHDSNM